ncbi:hypothetical protein DFH06DRAFT_1081621 [Mycena polygramma]|nr:hypothetical protein DFH06DRAFT_1081621 [Mycena polygramma]
MQFEHLRQDLAQLEGQYYYPTGGLHWGARRELQERITAARLLLAEIVYPVLTLPPEITSEIFVQAVNPLDKASSRSAPLLLLRICRLWRTIALSTPCLWAGLNFGFRRDEPTFSAQALGNFAEGWLSRSHDLPVSLGFDYLGAMSEDRVTQLLGAHASRLHHVHIRMSSDAVSGLQRIGKLPELRSLSFVTYIENLAIFQQVQTFCDAPRLREVALGCGITPHKLLLPWGQITTFSGERFTVTDCRRVLRDLPLLTKCTFTWLVAEPNAAPVIITHPVLKELTLEGDYADLLRILDLPTLRQLSIERYSSPLLPNFEWFRTVHGLTSVKLNVKAEFARAFLLALDRGKETDFLPHLESLEIASFDHKVDAPVTTALWSRSPGFTSNLGTTPLGYLRLVAVRSYGEDLPSWEEMGPIDWDALCDLWYDGMDVHVGTEQDNYLWVW